MARHAHDEAEEHNPPLLLEIPEVNPAEAVHSVNTHRAYVSDLNYFWGWARLVLGRARTYPVAVQEVVRFLEQHVEAPPAEIESRLLGAGLKRHPGPLAMETIARRLLVLGLAHRERGLANPCRHPLVIRLLRQARRRRAGEISHRHKPITGDVLEALLRTCDDSLRGCRDRALLLLAFASGGRRRSEVCAVDRADLTPAGDGYLLRIRRSKTDQYGQGHEVPVLGLAAVALGRWLDLAGIEKGCIFRGITGSGRLTGGLSGRAVAEIVKHRVRLAGLDPRDYSAHSLRSGFITEAGRQRIALGDVMALSGHRTIRTAMLYYRPGSVLSNPAARLVA